MTAKSKYLELRDQVDELAVSLENKHQKHMMCRAGCDLCCMDYSIFPVEFFSIAEALENEEFRLRGETLKNDGSCVLLKDHKCSIYAQRPIICRTHGLPLLFANDEGEWELSACELNFNDFDLEDFTDENTFPQDKYNSRLFMINKEFVKNFQNGKYGEFDLIPIRDLLQHFNNK